MQERKRRKGNVGKETQERKGKERKGKERKGKERKGKERKGKEMQERKGKETQETKGKEKKGNVGKEMQERKCRKGNVGKERQVGKKERTGKDRIGRKKKKKKRKEKKNRGNVKIKKMRTNRHSASQFRCGQITSHQVRSDHIRHLSFFESSRNSLYYLPLQLTSNFYCYHPSISLTLSPSLSCPFNHYHVSQNSFFLHFFSSLKPIHLNLNSIYLTLITLINPFFSSFHRHYPIHIHTHTPTYSYMPYVCTLY